MGLAAICCLVVCLFSLKRFILLHTHVVKITNAAVPAKKYSGSEL